MGICAAVGVFAGGHAFAIYDDSYIFLRFVQNIYGDCPLAFNCADGPLEAFTSPLYLLLLTVVGLPVGDLELTTQLLCPALLCAALGTAAVTAAHPRFEAGRAGLLLALATGLVLALDDVVLLNAVVGVETGLAALVIVLLARAALHPAKRGLRTLIVLAVLTRPECALFAITLPVLKEARDWRWWIPIAASAVVIASARWLIFADILPNTFWAKSGGTATHLQLGWAYLVTGFQNFPLVAAAPLALLAPATRRPVAWLLSASTLWLLFFLRSGGDFYEYSRLLFPLVPMLTALAAYGIFCALSRVPRLGDRQVIAAALTVVIAVGVARRQDIPDQGPFERVTKWAAVGKLLREVHPGFKVAATPVGAISYFSNAHIVDIVGVCNRDVAKSGNTSPALRFDSIGHERHDTDYILEQEPDIIVLLSHGSRPFKPGDNFETPVYGEFLLLKAVSEGRAPYVPYTPAVLPGVYWHMLLRRDHAR